MNSALYFSSIVQYYNFLSQQALTNVFTFEANCQFLIVADGPTLSYAEFFALANSVADQLVQKNISSGARIAVLSTNSWQLLVIYFACLLKNLIVSPLDPQRGARENNEILSILKPDLLLLEKSTPELAASQITTHFISEFNFSQPRPLSEREIKHKIDSINLSREFLIIFTSGTTGAPKGVIHSAKNLITTSLAFGEKFNFSNRNIFLHNLPMSYSAGILNQFFLPLLHKSQIVVGPRFSAEQALNFWQLPMRYNVNTFWLIPTIASMLLKLDRDIRGIEYCRQNEITACVGTAPLYLDIKKKFESKYGFTLHESYGLSETLFVTTNSPLTQYIENSVGPELRGVTLKLGPDSEVFIEAPWGFLGYLNDSGERPGVFASGDFGFLEGQNLVINGRKKDLIIRGGANISPRKIENILADWRSFEECQVVGCPDHLLGEMTICFFSSLAQKNKSALLEINKKIVTTLGRDYQIDHFVELESLPRNLNGKLDKAKLREYYKKHYSDSYCEGSRDK